MSKYFYEEYTHNLNSPHQIVPILVDLFNPQSVVDVGCGIGTFLAVFKQQPNVKTLLGIDGSWVDFTLYEKYCGKTDFLEIDLESPFDLGKKFDLAICLEVAEHLQNSSADIFVNSLTKLSDVVVFSAAVPNQGGQNHFNEQPLTYWKERFEKMGFNMYDILRPKFWNNPEIHYWYKQNMVVFSRIELKIDAINERKTIIDIIHPELLQMKENKIEDIRSGYFHTRFYIKVLLKNLLLKIKNSLGFKVDKLYR